MRRCFSMRNHFSTIHSCRSFTKSISTFLVIPFGARISTLPSACTSSPMVRRLEYTTSTGIVPSFSPWRHPTSILLTILSPHSCPVDILHESISRCKIFIFKNTPGTKTNIFPFCTEGISSSFICLSPSTSFRK